MRRRIQVLPDEVANQIAAGEVVERPASVVRELVENAVDAEATSVEVRIERGGRRRIRVSDDGVGMPRADVLLALDRHATSKIERARDLESVSSYGFRGEALPSIAAVSRLRIETHDGVEAVGTALRSTGGRILDVQDFPRRRGTTVEVQGLFFNAPPRAAFLKSPGAEARAVGEVISTLALATPGVGLTLTVDERPQLELPSSADPEDRLARLWGDDVAATLLPMGLEREGFRVEGFVQRPDAAEPGLRRGHLFVNGRPFRDAALQRAVHRGYRTTVPPSARPWFAIYLTVPPGEVDVNVHPAKAEVRFRRQAFVEELVEEGVRGALGTVESSAFLGRRPMEVREPAPTPGAPGPGLELSRSAPRPGARPSPSADDQMALFVSAPAPEPGAGGAEEPGVAHLVEGSRLWQLHNTYILAETRDGLLIVDQHSAHERVLFHRLMEAYARGGEASQRLLFPVTLRLEPDELSMVEEVSGLLGRAGFEVEPFGSDTVILRSVPNPHPYFDPERCFREMVAELTQGTSDLMRSARNQHERIAMTFACKSAIKAGQRLSESEMQELFDALFATELPYHDVHGRPTIVRLSAAELERKFNR